MPHFSYLMEARMVQVRVTWLFGRGQEKERLKEAMISKYMYLQMECYAYAFCGDLELV